MKSIVLIGLIWCTSLRVFGQEHYVYPDDSVQVISVNHTLLPTPELPSVFDTVFITDSLDGAKGFEDFIHSQANDSILHALGKQNARLYFRRPAVFTAAALGTTFGIATAGITLAVPITLAAIPAKVKEKDIPDPYLMQSPSYMAGYTAEAKKRKRMIVLKGTGVGVIGAGVVVGTLYLLLMSISHI